MKRGSTSARLASTSTNIIAPTPIEKPASILKSAPSDVVSKTAASQIATKTESGTAKDGDDREDATYFSSWGAPESRTGPSQSTSQHLRTMLTDDRG
jgi:hypothetical protein